MLNISLKLVCLVAVLIGLEKQVIIAYYNIIPKQDIISSVESLTPIKPIATIKPTPQPIQSSNIIMAWYNNKELRSRSLSNEEMNLLQKLGQSLPKEKFNDLLEIVKTLPKENLTVFLREKENLLVSSINIASIN